MSNSRLAVGILAAAPGQLHQSQYIYTREGENRVFITNRKRVHCLVSLFLDLPSCEAEAYVYTHCVIYVLAVET